MTIEQVNVQRYSDAVAAYAAAVDKMLGAAAALQAKAEAMRAADPTTCTGVTRAPRRPSRTPARRFG